MGFLRWTSPSCIHSHGYGMVAAMCEEVQSPEREVPKAIVLSVAAAGVTGVIYLIPILVLPEVATLLSVQRSTDMPCSLKQLPGQLEADLACYF